ncbi:MAG TPA: LPS-assembly protein LptD [Burkholderiales bacterium]|nr:LPS-assembly protein LptD [Burkholderiales bacterium]
MHRLRFASPIVLLIFFLAPGAGADEPGLKLRTQSGLIPYSEGRDETTPMFIEADRLQGHQQRELEAEGNVSLRKRGAAVFSDYLYFAFPERELTVTGHVRFEKEGDVINGEKMFYNLDSESGYLEKPTYRFQQFRARGGADRMVLESRTKMRVDKATYTNCDVGDDDWFMRVDKLELDRQRDVGVARNATVIFKGVPLLYSPYLDFSLSGTRKTGLLPPTIGSTGQSGFEVTQPFYWNIAPNRDATIAPRVLAKRGVLLNTELRYLEPSLSGQVRAEYLPDDREKQETRYGYSWQHRQHFGHGFSGSLDLQGVSDDTYFTDLSDKIAATSQTNLPREGTLFYDGNWWNLNARVQRFQTLQDPLAPVTPPYARVPQVTLNVNRQTDYYLDFGLQGEYVDFDHPFLLNGKRQILYPSISVPLQTSYFYVTPKIGYHDTRYSFEDPNLPDQTRGLPIYSIDSAITFERNARFRGRDFIQTLEPRLYYVYIPFRPQDQLPIFDTAEADFSLAQIFTENQFTGGDRINDANQLTAALSSRLINAGSGEEQLRFVLGQRYYFKEQQVFLSTTPRDFDRSDVLVAMTGRITPSWVTDIGVQYSGNASRMERSNVALRYQPGIGKLMNFGYRFTRDSLEQVDLSSQWPLGRHWSGLARWNYTLRDKRLLEGLAGVEYNAGCWAARFVMHRFVSATQEYINAMFFQLELNGVSRIGSNPLELLRQSVTGYTKTNEPLPAERNPFPVY